MTDDNHALGNAQAHYESIVEAFAKIDKDGEICAKCEQDEDACPCDEFEAARFDVDGLQDSLRESALSVMVREPWKEVGDATAYPDEFEILLTTGGPALRIRGDLNEHGEPSRAYMEYQDWGTPWTQFFGPAGNGMDKVLRRYAQLFYFGEG